MPPFKLEDGDAVEVPCTSVALVQNEAEALRTPNRDLRGMFLGQEERWHVVPFGERSFRAALPTTDLYDALVFGYNAIHESGELKAALRQAPPSCHMVILHQFGLDCLEFLQGDLALRLEELPSRSVHAEPPPELCEEDEVLLNWPHQLLRLEPGDCQALRYFSLEPDSAWRVVLEVECERRRFPVLVRTAATADVRVVACSLLLDVHNGVHRKLLENLLTYATLGRPRVAVLDVEDCVETYDPARLAAKLRLQGASTMVVQPGPRGVRVGDWPLKVADRVVMPARSDGKPNTAVLQPADEHVRATAERWKKAGGAIVEIAANGDATAHMEMDDTHAIVRRWATWLHGAPEDSWEKRTFQLRAVLRMLAAVDPDQRAALELRTPDAYAAAARALLGPRVQDGSLEETIGTTAAAYDIDTLVGGCLGRTKGKTRAAVRRWLQDQVEHEPRGEREQREGIPLEERLDVARALADPQLLARVLASVDRDGGPLGATAVIRLREAAVACRAGAAGWKPALKQIDSARLASPALARELDGRLLASAEFVAAAAAFKRELGDDRELAAYTGDALDDKAAWTALATLARLGSLAQGESQEQRSAQEVSAEALALHRYMGSDGSSTFQIWPQATEIPPKAVESVLRELARARKQRTAVHRQRTALGLSVPIAAGIALGTMTAVLYGEVDHEQGLRAPWPLALFGWAIPPLLLFGLWFLLGKVNRDERDMRLARHVLTALSLVVAVMLGLWLTSDLVELGSIVTTLAILALASVVVALLDRVELAAGWASSVIDMVTRPETAAAIGRRLPGGRKREQQAAGEVRSPESA